MSDRRHRGGFASTGDHLARPPAHFLKSLLPAKREWPDWRSLRASNDCHPSIRSFQACSFFLQGWGLIDLPLRASNEGLRRPRVARAQKIIRLHPLRCSASKKDIWPLPFYLHLTPLIFKRRAWLNPRTAHNFFTRPPSGTPRRAMIPGEGLPTLLSPFCKGMVRLPFTARIERALSECARSASKKGI